MSETEEILEIVIAARDWDDAKAKLENVSIDEKTKITRRNINGLFMVMAQLDGSLLTDNFYQKIRKHKDISILSDSASWARNREVLDEIYKVETELRKLLLHVLDLVEAFYDMFTKTQYAKKFAEINVVTYPNHLDPLTSRLMLGEIIEVLKFDLSWTRRNLTAADLSSLLRDSSDISALSTRLDERLKPRRPWTIISEVVLSQPVSWSEIEPKLVRLKEYRNKAAHFQIVTQAEKEYAIETARNVVDSIVRRKPASAKQLKVLDSTTQTYTKELLGISQQTRQLIDTMWLSDTASTAIAGFATQQTGLAETLALINDSNSAAMAKALTSARDASTVTLEKIFARRPRFGASGNAEHIEE